MSPDLAREDKVFTKMSKFSVTTILFIIKWQTKKGCNTILTTNINKLHTHAVPLTLMKWSLDKQTSWRKHLPVSRQGERSCRRKKRTSPLCIPKRCKTSSIRSLSAMGRSEKVKSQLSITSLSSTYQNNTKISVHHPVCAPKPCPHPRHFYLLLRKALYHSLLLKFNQHFWKADILSKSPHLKGETEAPSTPRGSKQAI